jgi:DNA-entry nuclease
MPTTKRGEIGSVKPTGWHTVKYDNVDGKYLYNRCHLIGYQLTAENANEKNLITGTRYLNVDGMLPFENEVADYVENTGNHVLYRVTPIFVDDELVARGVQMEAYSVEDNGSGVCFNVYCYNNQPDIVIDYATGDSHAVSSSDNFDDGSTTATYIVNLNTKKFHTTACQYGKKIKTDNKKTYVGSRESLINNGYEPCQSCNP